MLHSKLEDKLINYFSIAEINKSYLLEIFISKLFNLLQVGQRIKLEEIGYFYKIEFKLTDTEKYNFKNVPDTVIIYSETEQISEISEDQLFFNPTNFEFQFDPKANIFSLSFGKNYISNELIQSGHLLLPFSENEYQTLIDSKLEKLILESKNFISFLKETPCLNFDLESGKNDITFQNQIKTLAEFSVNEIEVEDEIPQIKSTDTQEFDFSKHLSDELDDKNFSPDLDYKSGDLLTTLVDDNISIDSKQLIKSFDDSTKSPTESIFDELLKVDDILENSSLAEDVESNYIKSDNNSSDLSIDNLDITLSQRDDFDLDIAEKIDWNILLTPDYESMKVKFDSITKSEIINETEVLQQNDDAIPFDDKIIDDVITNIQNEHETTTENIETKTDENYVDIEKHIEQLKKSSPDSDDSINKTDFDLSEDTLEKKSTDNQQDLEYEIIIDPTNQKRYDSKDKSKSLSNKKSKKFWISLVILFIVASTTSMLYYFFPNYFQTIYTPKKEKTFIINDKNVISIDREFHIPITFPYIPKENQTIGNNSLINHNNGTKTFNISSENQIIKDNQNKNIQEASQKITETITKLGDIYIVQVSSFKNEKIANNEVEKIKLKGYDAFIEKAEIVNKGIWYRVKVGNFKSLQEAFSFQKKYNKGEL